MGFDCSYVAERLLQFSWMMGFAGVAIGIVIGALLHRWANREYLP